MVTPVEIILIFVILYQGVSNYLERREYKKERQELISKIMSRDYSEYAGGAYLERYRMPPNQVPQDISEEDLLAERQYREQMMNTLPVD